MLHFSAHTGCFVSGLFLEGADWDVEHSCLTKSQPRVLVVELPIVKIIPIEARRLKLQVLLLGDTMAGCLLTSFCFHISIAGSPFPLSTSSTILSLPLAYKVGHLTLCLMLAFITVFHSRGLCSGGLIGLLPLFHSGSMGEASWDTYTPTTLLIISHYQLMT